MKNLKYVLLVLLLGNFALAAEVPVYDSIFMAAGYSNGNQHANVLKLMNVLRTQTSYNKVERLELKFVNAVVNTETQTVTYTFVDVVDKADRIQCTYNLVFRVKPENLGQAKLLDARANERCQRDD